MNLIEPKSMPEQQPSPQPTWFLSPVIPVRVELVDAPPGADHPDGEPPDLLVESFCEV
jgi:hypothetical protein